MTLQFIHDSKENTTEVYRRMAIFKRKFSDLQKEGVKNTVELAAWQKQIIDERL